jgi:hypothetical protein
MARKLRKHLEDLAIGDAGLAIASAMLALHEPSDRLEWRGIGNATTRVKSIQYHGAALLKLANTLQDTLGLVGPTASAPQRGIHAAPLRAT